MGSSPSAVQAVLAAQPLRRMKMYGPSPQLCAFVTTLLAPAIVAQREAGLRLFDDRCDQMAADLRNLDEECLGFALHGFILDGNKYPPQPRSGHHPAGSSLAWSKGAARSSDLRALPAPTRTITVASQMIVFKLTLQAASLSRLWSGGCCSAFSYDGLRLDE